MNLVITEKSPFSSIPKEMTADLPAAGNCLGPRIGPDCKEFVSALAPLQNTKLKSIDTTPYFPRMELGFGKSSEPAHLEVLGSAPMFANSEIVQASLKNEVGPAFGIEGENEAANVWGEVTRSICNISKRMFEPFPQGNGFVAGALSADNHAMLGYNIRFESIYGIAGVEATEKRATPLRFCCLPNRLNFGGTSLVPKEAAYRRSRLWGLAKNVLLSLPWRGINSSDDPCRHLIAVQWRLMRKSTANRGPYYSERVDIFPWFRDSPPNCIELPTAGLVFASGFHKSTRDELVQVCQPSLWNCDDTAVAPTVGKITAVKGRGLALNRYCFAKNESDEISVIEDQVKFSLDPASRVLGVSLTRFELPEIVTDFRRVPPSIAATKCGVH